MLYMHRQRQEHVAKTRRHATVQHTHRVAVPCLHAKTKARLPLEAPQIERPIARHERAARREGMKAGRDIGVVLRRHRQAV